MRRYYAYIPAGGAPLLVGYVENQCYANPNPRCPGAVEVAEIFFGKTVEISDGGPAVAPRKSPCNFERVSGRVFRRVGA